MESRQEHRTRDEQLDERIDQMLTGKDGPDQAETGTGQMAREFARLAAEESPRMSSGARTRGLEVLRAGASTRRAARRPSPFGFLSRVPRWAQIGAVALVVVILANGVSIAAADALPGSLLYPFKRMTEGGQLLLQNSSGERAKLWMNLANTRLDELQRLLNSGAKVYPSALDAVDESILRALTELTGTRGQERVALLQELTALAIRQQQILQQMAQNVSPADRARLEQTERLLQGVANYATSPDAVTGPDLGPLQFLTPTVPPMVTPSPTNAITPLPSRTPTPQPSFTAVPAMLIAPLNGESGNARKNSRDNADSTDALNDNVGDNGADPVNDNAGNGDDDNLNDNDGSDTGSGNSNTNDNGGNDSSGNDNSDDNASDDGDDNGGDNASDNGNDNAGDHGDDNGNDNDDNDHSGGGSGNDNGGGGSGHGDQDDNGNDNGDGDNNGNGNGGGGQDDNGSNRDNDNDNGGGDDGDNGNDNHDDDQGGNGNGGGGQDDDGDKDDDGQDNGGGNNDNGD